jgi:drug/metabolite transporter (DMT)-like permease
MISARGAVLTAVAMLAFAGNSLLCRLALGPGLIDPATFTSVRVLSGAATLGVFALLRRTRIGVSGGWRSALMLAAYMVFFSFAYTWLSAGTGALILFGAVQLTMFGAALRAGERFVAISWFGLALAAGGLVYLVLPGVRAPDPLGAALMAVAGIAWGGYSLLGRGAADPLAATTTNFVLAAPLALAASAAFRHDFDVSPHGLALAIASGAITSGCGYVIWYAALAQLSAARASVVQLSVPIIAALGGVALLSETMSARLLLASAATLGGVAIVLAQRAAGPVRG